MFLRVAILGGCLIAAFLLGWLPMWSTARDLARQRDSAQRELTIHTMAGSLAAAAFDGRRGDYEPARQAASRFFTALQEQIDLNETSALTAEQRSELAAFFQQRDNIITLLARSDPAAADRLSDLYIAFRKRTGR